MSAPIHLSLCLLLLLLSASQLRAWEAVELPSPASDTPVWYRCRVQVPDRLTVAEGSNPRDLWRSSTMLVLGDLPGSAEVFLNGQSILTTPGIPLGRSQRFKVPKDILLAKQFNTLVIRVDRGSLGKPPMLIDYFHEVRLGPAWELASREPGVDEFLAVADRPATAAYGEADFRLSATPLDATLEPIPGKRVALDESLAALQTDDDLVVEQLLHEPQVAQPTHLSFDARGRLWVSQYRQYPYPQGVKMLSRDQYYRSKYDRTPPAPPNHDPGADIISVHEDRDGDGIYESHKNVLEGLNMANSAVRGWGGFWVMHTPYLLLYADADGDDRPDSAPEVRLAGFGLEDTHSVANGLVWGPDGWLYGGQGSTTTSRVTRPGTDPEGAAGLYNEGPVVWRYHPTTREIEIFADGGGNIFGLSFDAEGRLFIGHNGGDTRGWHLIQGGQFLKQGKDPGKFGPPPNPYAFGELPMMRSTNPIPRFSNMSIVADGTALPARLRGQFVGVDPLHHYLVSAARSRRGSSFETTDSGFPLRSDDLTFRPVFLTNAPDGSLFVADFCEEFIAHGQNYQGQIDPASGRIYRLRGKHEPLRTDYNLEAKTGSELVETLAHPNLWHRQTAVRLLGQRADPATVPALLAALEAPTPHPALEALWALHQMGRLDGDLATRALRHPATIVRTWAIRLVGDSGKLPDQFFSALTSMDPAETDAELRCQILSTAARLPAAQALPLLQATEFPAADAADPYIPLMTWFLIESHCADDRELVLSMFERDASWAQPVISGHVISRLMRRFAAAGTRSDLLTCARLLELAPTPADRAALLAGFEQAFEGRVPPALPDELVAATGRGSISMQIRQGDPAAIAAGLALLADASAPDHLAAIRAFGTRAHPDAQRPLLKIATAASGREYQLAALTSLQIYTDPAIATTLTGSFPGQPPAAQAAILNLLASRPAWCAELLDSQVVPAAAISADLIARIRLHDDPALRDRLPPAAPVASAATGEAVRAVLAAKPGDPYRGELTYTARCAGCHTLFFKGGKVGPDLTRYQRDDLSTMLVSILDPNAEIREGYENYIATTKDGRILSGFLAEDDANTIVLRGFDGSNTTIPRDALAELKPAGRSLMPEGLLGGLDDQQLRDLFAYLKISQPITR